MVSSQDTRLTWAKPNYFHTIIAHLKWSGTLWYGKQNPWSIWVITYQNILQNFLNAIIWLYIKKKKEARAKWNVIPFFSFSRIESVKTNVLTRMLYLFQTLPLQLNQNQFNEWDKMVMYIWQGERPKVRFETLQLPKDKGVWGLPSLRDYYFAAQMRAMICWCDPSYDAQWKILKRKYLPSHTSNLSWYKYTKVHNIINNPWVDCTLNTWKTIIK